MLRGVPVFYMTGCKSRKDDDMKKGLRKREALTGFFFLLPNLLGFFAFTAFPVLAGLLLSFTDYDGFTFKNMHWVGISNFIKLFQDDYFIISFKNNLIYTATSVPLTLFFSLLLALALNRKTPLGGMFKTVYFFPTITSMVAIAIVWTLLFHPTMGPINNFLRAMGMQNPPGWLASSKWALATVVTVSVWKYAGYYMIMILAGLQTIPGHLYESSEIDGASILQRFLYITWPMLSPTMFMVTILSIINSFQVFDLVYIMTEGGPGSSTNVLVFRIYQEGFKYTRFGYASAMAYFLFLVIFIITLLQFRGQKKWVNYMQ